MSVQNILQENQEAGYQRASKEIRDLKEEMKAFEKKMEAMGQSKGGTCEECVEMKRQILHFQIEIMEYQKALGQSIHKALHKEWNKGEAEIKQWLKHQI